MESSRSTIHQCDVLWEGLVLQSMDNMDSHTLIAQKEIADTEDKDGRRRWHERVRLLDPAEENAGGGPNCRTAPVAAVAYLPLE
jgi:hypothetical protein